MLPSSRVSGVKTEVRISLAPADVARFEAAAQAAGGRAALVRRFLSLLPEIETAAPPTPRIGGSDLGKILVRLPAQDYQLVVAEAARLGLRKGPWVNGLITAWLRKAPTLGRPSDLALIAAQLELRRIALALRQIASGSSAPTSEAFAELAFEVRQAIEALRAALAGYARYWDIAP